MSAVPSIKPTSEIVRAARHHSSQKEFAVALGIGQPQLSRYETGRQEPPADVLLSCYKILADRLSRQHIPTADDLAERIRAELAGIKKAAARSLVQGLLDTLGRRGPGRPIVGAGDRPARRRRASRG